MKAAVVIAVLAIGGYFAWKQIQKDKAAEPPPVEDSGRKVGADTNNRVQGLSGAAPDPDAR